MTTKTPRSGQTARHPGKAARATLRTKNQLTLPERIRKALHAQAGDELSFDVREDGTVLVRALRSIPADQAWFWDEDWQSGEREADSELVNGEGETFLEPGDMFNDLESDA